jgi:hypothetical protein
MQLTHKRIVRLSAGALACVIALGAHAATDQHYDYTSFETGFQQPHFDVLNYPSINGNYMMTSTDTHRPEMVANGNVLAEFYNNFNADYNHPTAERRTPAQEAAFINTYTLNNSNRNGPRPDWLILNEISSSQWQLNPGAPSLSEHRTWVIDTVTLLNDTYGYKVITYSPYETVGTANAPSWQALAAKSYVAIESYQSGTEVWNSGSTNAARLAWAQGKYQSSKNTYLAAGVPASKLFVSEHFANNSAITSTGAAAGWGRAGLASASDWDTVIQLRQDAIYNVGFAGFLAYNWGGNGMGVTQAEQLQHEYWYRTRLVMPGQQPQWLSDTAINVNGTVIPLSWSQQLNWLGGVPNAPGAVANLYRTNSAARTITLDGSKTVGSMSFNSSFGYTITAGSGGSLTLNNSGAGAVVAVPVGAHAISVPIALADHATFNVTSALALSGGISNASGKAITKTGAGSLTISGTQTHGVGATFNANDGITNFNSSAGGNLALVANSTVNFNSAQHLSALTVAANKKVTLAAGGANALRIGTFNISGKLDLNDNPAIVDYSSSDPIASIRSLIKTGYNNGSWNGNGIMSTVAQSSPVKAAIGYAEASSLFSNFPATYAGQSIDSTTIVLRFTVQGDADFSGKTDILDFNALATNFGKTNMTWRQGDFDYSGTIDIVDFNILATTFGQSVPINSAPFAGMLAAARESTASVPLPAPVYAGAIGLIGAFAATWTYRRR